MAQFNGVRSGTCCCHLWDGWAHNTSCLLNNMHLGDHVCYLHMLLVQDAHRSSQPGSGHRREKEKEKEKDAASLATAAQSAALDSRLRRDTPFLATLRFKNDLPEVRWMLVGGWVVGWLGGWSVGAHVVGRRLHAQLVGVAGGCGVQRCAYDQGWGAMGSVCCW